MLQARGQFERAEEGQSLRVTVNEHDDQENPFSRPFKNSLKIEAIVLFPVVSVLKRTDNNGGPDFPAPFLIWFFVGQCKPFVSNK